MTDLEDLDDRPDHLVPDPVVWRELGVTSMTGYRWSRDPTLDFPPAIKIKNRNFRSRRMLEAFKARLLRQAIAARKSEVAARPSPPK
jgi:hypothetical protein